MTRLPLSIDPAHPAFAGHFPSQPIVPGVVLLDEGLRAIATWRGDDIAAGHGPCRIGVAKFLSPVGPGEAVRLELEPSPSTGYQLRIYAGAPDHERLALTGSVTYPSKPAPDGAA